MSKSLEEAQEAIVRLCRIEIRMTNENYTKRGIGKASVKEERTAIKKLLKLILRQEPDDKDVEETINLLK